MYFDDNFPVIPYDVLGDNNFKSMTNLLRRVAIRSKVKANTLFYDTYDVKNGETPESIAHKLYGDAELHWIVLMTNDIVDVYHQWPMSEAQFRAYINDKYDDINGIHHYEISQQSGDTTKTIRVGQTNEDFPSATPITNYEYEVREQDEKRKIRLLDPSYVSQVESEFKRLMKETNF